MASIYDSFKELTTGAAATVGWGLGYGLVPAVAACGARAAVHYAVNPANFVGCVATGLVSEYAGYAAFCLTGPVGGLVVGWGAKKIVEGAFYVTERSIDAYRKNTQNQASLQNAGADWDAADDMDPDDLTGEGDLLVHNNAVEHHQEANPQVQALPAAGFLSRVSCAFFARNNQPALQAPAAAQVVRSPQPFNEDVLRQALKPDALATGIVFNG